MTSIQVRVHPVATGQDIILNHSLSNSFYVTSLDSRNNQNNCMKHAEEDDFPHWTDEKTEVAGRLQVARTWDKR